MILRILRNKLALVGAAALVGVVLGLAFLATDARGSDGPAVRGAACTKVGEHRKNRSGTEYVCAQRVGDDCPVWHAADPKKGPWPKPSPCVCPSKSASAPASLHTPKSPNSKPAASGSASTTPAAKILPVTGAPTTVGAITALGLLMVAGGAAVLLTLARRRDF
jgi:LPXTG-motif cell wall-anchored protein